MFLFRHFYVVALKLKDGEEPNSSGSYENNELVTYAEARKSSDPKPYIAAVFTPDGVDESVFVLGDGKNTSGSTSRRRRSAASDYYNGPLEPGTRYSIFQRIIFNDQVFYLSQRFLCLVSGDQADLRVKQMGKIKLTIRL